MKNYIRSILLLPFYAKLFLISEALFGLGIGIWGLNLNFHLKTLGISEYEIGFLLSIGSISTAVLSFFFSRLLDRWGFKPAMVVGCVLKGIGMIAIAFSPYFYLLVVAQLIIGLGDALVLSSEFPFVLSLVEEKNKSTVYNLLISVFMLFLIAGNLLGEVFKEIGNVKSLYVIVLLVSGLCFVLLGFIRSRIPNSRVENCELPSYNHIFSSNKMKVYMVYSFISGCSFNILLAMGNLVFREYIGYVDKEVSWIFSINNFVSFMVTLSIPLILQKFRNIRIAIFTMFCIIGVLICMSFYSGLIFTTLWIVVSAFRIVLPGTVDSNMLQSVESEKQGAYSGLRIFTNQLGVGTGAYVAGISLGIGNVSMLMILAATSMFLQLFVYYFGCRRYLLDH